MGNQDDIKNKDYSVTTAIWIAAALLAADVYENNKRILTLVVSDYQLL